MNDLMEGYGTFSWPNGKKYIGYWKNGKQHGIGSIININGKELRGEFMDGKRLRWIS